MAKLSEDRLWSAVPTMSMLDKLPDEAKDLVGGWVLTNDHGEVARRTDGRVLHVAERAPAEDTARMLNEMGYTLEAAGVAAVPPVAGPPAPTTGLRRPAL